VADDPLKQPRERIDAIDRELVRLLNERADCVQRIGEAKRQSGGSIFVPHREREVFSRIAEANQGPLSDTNLVSIWREIMSSSIALERGLVICHLGKRGAFTHQAARLKFGDSVTYTDVEAISTVFDEVERGHADYGVVPIENSTDGGITDTIDAFLATSLRIVNELHLRIRHHLLANCPRSQIQRVYSKHTVFGQCRSWLAANLPGVELIEVGNTTQAAGRAAAESGSAAIASADAANSFDVPVVEADIEDNPTNTTRFVVLADRSRAAQPTGNDKTSLMFGVQDQPGALYEALIPFHSAGISLSRIESRPSRRQPWEYLFFIDLLGHEQDPAVEQAIASLSQSTTILQVLGSYPRAETPLNP